MAGSYGHVAKDDGSLLPAEKICSMLECMSGDVAEAIEEMYGMIWFLADELVTERLRSQSGMSMKSRVERSADEVERARLNWIEGMRVSPSTEGVLWRGE